MMKNLNKFIAALSILLGIFLLSACSANDAGMSEDTLKIADYTPDFYQEWTRSNKIDFASMTVTKTVTTERTAWYKIGQRVAVYSFDIYLRAYINMDEMKPGDINVDTERKVISIKLPPVKSEIAGRSEDLREEYENIGIFRSHPDSRERSALKERANADFIKEFKGNPVYRRELESTALKKAHAYFRALGEAAGYKVEFVNSLPINSLKD